MNRKDLLIHRAVLTSKIEVDGMRQEAAARDPLEQGGDRNEGQVDDIGHRSDRGEPLAVAAC